MKMMQCGQCKNVIGYNSYYHCYECNCGNTYNALGQELAPRETWEDEYEEDYY